MVLLRQAVNWESSRQIEQSTFLSTFLVGALGGRLVVMRFTTEKLWYLYIIYILNFGCASLSISGVHDIRSFSGKRKDLTVVVGWLGLDTGST